MQIQQIFCSVTHSIALTETGCTCLRARRSAAQSVGRRRRGMDGKDGAEEGSEEKSCSISKCFIEKSVPFFLANSWRIACLFFSTAKSAEAASVYVSIHSSGLPAPADAVKRAKLLRFLLFARCPLKINSQCFCALQGFFVPQYALMLLELT